LRKAFLNIFEADELDRFHNSKIMAMVAVMRVVVAYHSPIVARVKVMVDIGQAVPGNSPCSHINPYLPAQLPVSAPIRNLVGFIRAIAYANVVNTEGKSFTDNGL